MEQGDHSKFRPRRVGRKSKILASTKQMAWVFKGRMPITSQKFKTVTFYSKFLLLKNSFLCTEAGLVRQMRNGTDVTSSSGIGIGRNKEVNSGRKHGFRRYLICCEKRFWSRTMAAPVRCAHLIIRESKNKELKTINILGLIGGTEWKMRGVEMSPVDLNGKNELLAVLEREIRTNYAIFEG